jgi:3-oxoacyl-[acyl-carrier protein] reductase
VLVTGAANGIGRAIASRLLAEGAAVALADVDAERCAEAAATLGDGAHAVEVDVADPASVDAGVERAVELLGGLDALVSNAGIVRDRRLGRMSDEDWRTVIEIDLGGCFHCARAALEPLTRSGHGRIVNISSRAYLGNPGQANYSAAKAGVLGLTRALSLELGAAGIAVNAVAPGMIETELIRSHPSSEEIIRRAAEATPLGRIGKAEDVAAAVAFLLSDDAAYVSGEVLHVTGGRY